MHIWYCYQQKQHQQIHIKRSVMDIHSTYGDTTHACTLITTARQDDQVKVERIYGHNDNINYVQFIRNDVGLLTW